ncbi:MAG: DUF4032 domain-containing protein [Ignavibacteriales bacterium]|nr:MAG: DUF4032 domain-containing protein [Ignavibacteriales bacterium]
MDKKYLVLNLFPEYRPDLEDLPWNIPLNEWTDKHAKFLDIRKGVSKHTVRFIKTKDYAFAIKQTSPLNAYFESETFSRLLEKGIHTLIPAGYIFYKKDLFEEKTNEKDALSFLVTILEGKSIPHSILFKWDFSETSRKSIYRAAAELLAELHYKNIFWGDASLSNILIKFIKSKDEKGKTKTELKAFLSDSETIQFLKNISAELKQKDLQRFFESMKNISQELPDKSDSVVKDDQEFFRTEYQNNYSLLTKAADFENKTGLNIRKHFYRFTDQYSVDSIFKQIEEHKWYLSEKAGHEIDIKDAANEWVKKIYKPIINEFNKIKLFDYFPDTNSVKLYADIMAHKYYLSIEKGEDIGIETAIRSYGEKYSNKEQSIFTKFIERLLKRITKIVPPNYNL